jgi:hypothetical protein
LHDLPDAIRQCVGDFGLGYRDLCGPASAGVAALDQSRPRLAGGLDHRRAKSFLDPLGSRFPDQQVMVPAYM